MRPMCVFQAVFAVVAIASSGSARAEMVHHPVNPDYDNDEECGSGVDLTAPGQSMEHVPVHNQSQLGICYASAAASMMDAWKWSHGRTDYTHVTSPLACALGVAGNASVKTDFEGGSACSVVNFYKDPDLHACSNDVTVEELAHPERLDIKELTDWLAQRYERYQAWKDSLGFFEKAQLGVEGSSAWEKRREFLKHQTELVVGCLDYAGMPRKFLPKAELMDTIYDAANRNDFLQGMLLDRCSRSGKYFPDSTPGCSDDPGISEKTPAHKVFAAVNRMLNGKAPVQPVEIGYCSEVLLQGDLLRGVNRSTGEFKSHVENGKKVDDCGIHSSLIVGRKKFPDGKCRYLIRNSWGTDCLRYMYCDDWMPDAARSSSTCVHWDKWECSAKGDVWVDADALAKNITDISQIH